MGRALSAAYPTARQTFEEANDLLGYDLARLCFEGPADELTSTRHCQPARRTDRDRRSRAAARPLLRTLCDLGDFRAWKRALIGADVSSARV